MQSSLAVTVQQLTVGKEAAKYQIVMWQLKTRSGPCGRLVAEIPPLAVI